MALRDIIKESVQRVMAGKGSVQDKAIKALLEKNKKYQEQIQRLKDGKDDKLPIHQQKPWYFED